ncbi:hypothetical protein [Algoriphagus machipongonensis]|uniref:DUF4345 domain-containing protein n=1 Tax=Algoriphagus machipongonensis TaxID=388413 RepID=A3HU82_9BACT|nr:hypothetical protein [Algoriphagus machipongonensis]EAZ81704.1 hypothetical protein ALPR1_00645 [Algoriphagus machipongonensis]
MDDKSPFPVFPMHFRGILLLAGMYTIAWSAFFKWFGSDLCQWLSMGNSELIDLPSNYYGSFGLIVGVIIFISAFYPVSWVYLIIAGISGKIILAIWFTLGFLPDLGWNKRTGFQLIGNEIIWLIPLILIFLRGCQVKNYLEKNEVEES